MSLASLRVWRLPYLGTGGGPVLGRVDLDSWHLELVGVLASHLAEPGHLPPDRRLVHPEAFKALEAPIEVPYDPEADHVLDHLAGDRSDSGPDERGDDRCDRLVDEGRVLVPGLAGDATSLG